MNLIDQFYRATSPKRYAQRITNRIKGDIMARKYEAANNVKRSRRGQNQTTTANTAVTQDLRTLRQVSHALVENNGFARQGLRVIRNNTVGTGIRPSIDLGDDAQEDRIMNLWKHWADTPHCDWDERETFYGMQSLAINTVTESGEAIIRRRRNSDGTISLQIHEGDYLDLEKYSTGPVGNIQHGIERDGRGKIVAYWLFDNLDYEMGEISLESRRIPAEDVIHLFYQARAGQRRGLPWLSTSANVLDDVQDYSEAEIMGKKVSASFAAFIESSAEGIMGLGTDDQALIDRIEPGMVEYLGPGETVRFNTPSQVIGYQEFVNSNVQTASAGLGVMYPAMSNNLAAVNFSSYRAGHIEMMGNCQEWQERVMKYMNWRVWGWWMESLQMRGLVKEYIPATWTPPRRQMLDPVKESKGIENMLGMRLLSWRQAVKEQGRNPDEVLSEIAADQAKFEELGIVTTWDGSKAETETETVPDIDKD